jgi:RND superfamily putative drug exporter
MFAALGHFAYRRRRLVLAGALLSVAVAVIWGTGVFGSLASGGFDDPGSESSKAADVAAATVGSGEPDVVVLYRSADHTVDDPAFYTAVEQSLADLPSDAVRQTTTYWSSNAPQLVSTDRHSTYAVLQLTATDDAIANDLYKEIEPQLRDAPAGYTVELGGNRALFHDVNSTVEKDIQRAETLSMPIVLVLLVILFGGLIAASLPLAIGGLAILGAFTVVRLLTQITDVSIFSINIITMLGLGLAIDYALFIVSRFREELRERDDVPSALATTMRTAGRTVAFSGLTVAISLASLLLFPQMFLRSMGLGGIAAVLVAMLGALTVLPALLAVLGRRVNALRVPRPWRRRARVLPAADHAGVWYRIGRAVMRRPVAFIAVIVPLLLLLGSPFLRIQFGGVDERVLPEGAEARTVAETLDRDFPSSSLADIESIVTMPAGLDRSALDGYVNRVREVPGVTDAQVTGQAGSTARVDVFTGAEPLSDTQREVLADVRDVPRPAGSETLVGGRTAVFADLLTSLGKALPWMALAAVAVTLVLLFLAFGSVVLPIKAVAMNVLSLMATFGAVVWIFQEGHLASWLGFTPNGTIEASMPILILAIAFGLSMDYEVFLLSRIREQWDQSHDNPTAVATGLERTGRIITSLALLLAVVIGAFATSDIVFIKMIGVGLLIAVLVDATIIRALLVPATMRLLGRANWWAPRPLARAWNRYGVRETDAGSEVPRELVGV